MLRIRYKALRADTRDVPCFLSSTTLASSSTADNLFFFLGGFTVCESSDDEDLFLCCFSGAVVALAVKVEEVEGGGLDNNFKEIFFFGKG
jgi:hypothetical protein